MYTKHQWTSDKYFNFRYVKYLPKDFDPTVKYPLVIFLHGAGERGEDLDIAMRHGYMKYVREQGAEYPFIFIAPQCPFDKYWGCYTESLIAFLDDMCASLPIDPDRICLTGLSMGGTGTWMLAMADPDRYACIVPICGSGICWNAGIISKIPTRIYHGDCDDIVEIDESITMLRRLHKDGSNAELTICNGMGHNAWDVAYQDPGLIDWILAQKKQH